MPNLSDALFYASVVAFLLWAFLVFGWAFAVLMLAVVLLFLSDHYSGRGQ
jgi:hypothetical protein